MVDPAKRMSSVLETKKVQSHQPKEEMEEMSSSSFWHTGWLNAFLPSFA